MTLELAARGIVQILLILNMTFALLVMVRFRQVWRIQHRAIPLHVLLVASSYYLLLVTLCTRTLDWRAILTVPALLLGIASFVVLLRIAKKQSGS